MEDRLAELSRLGVSIWLDDLDRGRLASGGLQDLVDNWHVVGVTTNPSIFDHSISSGAAEYRTQIADLALRSVSIDEALRSLTAFDVRWACDLLRPAFDASGGFDGRVSIEVDPRLANQTDATVAEARAVHWLVDRENVLIKIPATEAGLPAITRALAEGISVNVTLLFALSRYEQVLDAWMSGLEAAHAAGHDLSRIHSVASLFVSRVDTLVDDRLDAIGTDEAAALRGAAGIANARLTWGIFEKAMASARWQALKAKGANEQRPLWASTSVKDKAFRDDRYVVDLVAPGCVNTMPEGTIRDTAAHGDIQGDTVTGTQAGAQQVFDQLAAIGIDMPSVSQELEDQGVSKFQASWVDLIATVERALGQT